MCVSSGACAQPQSCHRDHRRARGTGRQKVRAGLFLLTSLLLTLRMSIRVPTLQHNNLRMMFFGVFNQSIADAFVR